MAIQRLFSDNFEHFTLETSPSKTFVSSSSGITGSIRLFPRGSTIEKEIQPLSLFENLYYKDENLDDLRTAVTFLTKSDISDEISSYLTAVNSQQQSARKKQILNIVRFKPTFNFTSSTLLKNVVKDILMPYYRTIYPRSQFTYSNYHCLNFFTGSGLPEDSVLLYPNSNGPITGANTGSFYDISNAFTFDFWIKPTYTTDGSEFEYKAGSILHLSSSYALTLHSGSSIDLQGKPNCFRIALSLSSSADISPSDINLTTNQIPPQSLLLYSTDNSIKKDEWSHVSVRWGGPQYNFGTGSIVINSKIDNIFVITQSLILGVQDSGPEQPTVLCVGNYYEGGNSSTSAMERFFAADVATREGLVEMVSDTSVNNPASYAFTHPLNSEIHEIKLYNKYLTLPEIEKLHSDGPSGDLLNGLKLYLPPFFTEVSPYRQFVGTFGGVLKTPFAEFNGSTNDPFSAQMAFSVGGHYINLENYVRDFVTGNYPRLWSLSGSAFVPGSTEVRTSNEFLYTTGSVRKRLYTILPCDNGDFYPNFDLLNEFTGSTKFVDDLGNKEQGVISLRNIVDINDFQASKAILTSGSILDETLGARPEDIYSVPGTSLAILHRTRDNSSNQIVFFDISNIFYGDKIRPNTFIMKDMGISGSSDKINITIKDDGRGNLYRANSSGNHPTWMSIGNIFYNEGIVLLKSPQLFFWGEKQYEISFKGDQKIHIFTINSFAKTSTQTSSSNPSFIKLSSNDINENLANEPDEPVVFITGINVHDDNLNVIMRTKLAQPILKRSSDKMLFKIKTDF